MSLPRQAQCDALDNRTKRGATTYFALLSAEVAETDTALTMSEIAVAGYSRQPTTWTDPSKVPADQPVLTRPTAKVTFGPATADMTEDATHLALVTTASGTGNILKTWALSGGYRLAAGDFATLDPEALELTVQ